MAEVSKFEQIADRLRDEIRRGVYLPGAKLPSEDALAEDYGYALNTVRSALRLLVTEGLVESRPKSGNYVRVYRRIARDANKRLSAAQWGAGHNIWDVDAAGRRQDVDNIEVFAGSPPRDVAEVLGTSNVWIRKGRYLIDDRPIQVATRYLPADVVEGSAITQPDTGPGGTYARLAELGFAPVDFSERVVARMPDQEEIKLLKLLPATPVVQIRREAITGEGRVVEVNDMVCAGDAYVFHWRFTS